MKAQETVQLSTANILPQSEQSGERIGRSKLLEKIIEQAAEGLGISEPTAKRDWAYAWAWLFREIKES